MTRTLPKNNIDVAVLALVRGSADIKASLARLYLSGDINSKDVAACVGRFIDLADYNEILEGKQ